MPFWRLKATASAGAAQQRAVLNRRAAESRPERELELCHVAGGFDEPHFALLNRNERLINALAHQILEAHFPESIPGRTGRRDGV